MVYVYDSYERTYRMIYLILNYTCNHMRRNWLNCIHCLAVDLVVITAPSGMHYELAKRVLLAGKHCVVEKPMTTTEAEALDLVKTAKEV